MFSFQKKSLNVNKKILIKRFFLIFFIFLILFLFFLKNNFLLIKAQIKEFYPNSCLGGWQNPQNASKKPDLNKEAKLEDFNESNSAVLKNMISEIYCGDFQGNFPENSVPQKAILKFSWFIKEGKEENFETTSLFQIINSSSEFENLKNEEEIQNNSLDNNNFFLNKLFNFSETVFAQNLKDENDLNNIINNIDLNNNINSNSIESSSNFNNFFLEKKETFNNKKEEIFDIFYTFDGLNWINLGEVGLFDWQEKQFEIINFNWDNLDNFQIKIQSVNPKEVDFITYLDGVILQVEYSNLDEKDIKNYPININYDCEDLMNKIDLSIENKFLNKEIKEEKFRKNRVILLDYGNLNDLVFFYQLKIDDIYEFWIQNRDLNICKKLDNLDLSNKKFGFYDNILFFIDENNVLNGFDLLSNNLFSVTFENENSYLINSKNLKIFIDDKYLKFKEEIVE